MDTKKIESSKGLSNHQIAVYDFLLCCKKPESAYGILTQLNDSGLKAPPQVYRALEKLMKLGLVHKVHSSNKFIACNGAHETGVTAIAICTDCGLTIELETEKNENLIRKLVERTGFKTKSQNTEIYGYCKICLDTNRSDS